MYPVQWFPFSEHPKSDSCWSLSVGPEGRIYAAACCEMRGGETVKLMRYNEQTQQLDCLFEADKVIDDPRDSGRATQCKIHYSFAPSVSDGIMYMATHLSGPPIDDCFYSPWNGWQDSNCFRGAALIAYDTNTDQVLWWDTLFPKEGCRCLVIDEARGLLYALTCPRDHLFVYDLAKRSAHDLGRIGSINSQALLLDASHRVWSTRDDGRLVRYDPERDRIEVSPHVLPYNTDFQTGWHNVFYDAVAAPDGRSIFTTPWFSNPHMVRLWLDEGDWGRVEDLGPVTQDRSPYFPDPFMRDHCGGLTFGGDGQLYYVASRWYDPVHNSTAGGAFGREGLVWRMDPTTGAREIVAVLERPECAAQYVSRGAVDRNGDLFFAHVSWDQTGDIPVGIFKVTLPAECKRANAHLPIRIWG
jgi:hypothetical protein